MNENGARLGLYAATIFLSSAFLLVLEITAGRLLAPYIGVSLYTWTSIIGIILAGLSLGNWLGGLWADRGGGEGAAGLTLAGAGLFSLAILLLLALVAPLVQNSSMSLLSASFIYVFVLFFVPAVLLGVITPLLTTLALRLDSRTGHIVGRMHALAALGSIIGTFATGYWLIQYFGTRQVILGTAAGLFLLAVPFLRRRPRLVPVTVGVIAGLLIGATALARGFANPCDRESNYSCIRVVDESRRAPFGEARGLVLDHLIHGINHRQEAGMLIPPYMHLMDELVLSHVGEGNTEGLSFFFAGGGSYTQPRAVQALYPRATIVVAELDSEVTRMAEERLFVSTRGMTVLHEDARLALRRQPEHRFDVIVGDVFHDIAVPYHLVTQEYALLVKSRLKAGGLYTLNVVDAFPDPRLVKSLVKTLSTVFQQVHVWMETLPGRPERITFVLSAADAPVPPEEIRARRGFERRWFRVTEPMILTGTPLTALPLLTDDAAPVERLVSGMWFTALGR